MSSTSCTGLPDDFRHPVASFYSRSSVLQRVRLPSMRCTNRVDARRRARFMNIGISSTRVKACEFWRAIERSQANSSRDKPLATSGVSRMVLLITRTRAWAPVARMLVPQAATVSQIEERLGEGKSS